MAFVPKVEAGMSSTSGKFSKYSDANWKTIVGPKTPLSMMQHHPAMEDYPEAHQNFSKGVVPGYQGHVPKARDQFGSSAMGGLAPEPHTGKHKPLGAMSGHENKVHGYSSGKVPWEENYDWETQVYKSFQEKKTGVMPGYAGFRPGARDADGFSAFGGIPHDGAYGEGTNTKEKADWNNGRMKPDTDWRGVVNGIVPGYKGHVPNAIDKHGVTPFGKISQSGDKRGMTKKQLYVNDGMDSGDGGTHFGAQRGHTDTLLDKCNDVYMEKKSGYSGHMPNARDAWGTTVYNPN